MSIFNIKYPSIVDPHQGFNEKISLHCEDLAISYGRGMAMEIRMSSNFLGIGPSQWAAQNNACSSYTIR